MPTTVLQLIVQLVHPMLVTGWRRANTIMRYSIAATTRVGRRA
jgi:hypothetical protein